MGAEGRCCEVRYLRFVFALVLPGCVSPQEPDPLLETGLVWRKPPAVEKSGGSCWYPFPAGQQVVWSEKTRREYDAWGRVFSPETYEERKRIESR